MEPGDVQLIEQYLEKDRKLATLYKEHITFEKQLSKLDNKLFLTPEEDVLRKELQKKKLKGKDLIESILKKYRGGNDSLLS